MSRAEIELRLFVVGAPRSGTTLVQSLLAAHPAMTSFTESHFFDRHFSLLPPLATPVLTRDPRPRLREFLAENGASEPDAVSWFAKRGRAMTGCRPLLPFSTRHTARRLLRVLDQLALRRNASGWIEKTPRHLRYLPFLQRISAAEAPTRFVHVVRQGLEVVSSLHTASQTWERPYDLATCARRWNADVRFSLRRADSPADHFVFYEELTSQPERTVRGLVEELGLEWHPDMLERYPATADQLVTDKEPWKSNVGRTISGSRTSHEVLSAGERDRVNAWLRHDLYRRLRERTHG